MPTPLQIQFHNLGPSPAIEDAVRKYADRLERFHPDIMSCRVTVEASHKHKYKGNLYHIVVDVKTRGDEVVVSRAPDDRQEHEDIYVAIRDAFNAARRQLQDRIDIRRGYVKRKPEQEPPEQEPPAAD